MQIEKKEIESAGTKLFIEKEGKEIGRVYLYLMQNSLHEKPFGFMEDLFVDESLRGQGIGTKLIEEAVKTAKEKGCYKLIATSRSSRDKVHELYKRLNFKDYGLEFRIDF